MGTTSKSQLKRVAAQSHALPLDVLTELLKLYKACLEEGHPYDRPPKCPCSICKAMRRLVRVMPESKRG